MGMFSEEEPRSADCEAILFDFDGTLADSFERCCSILADLAGKMGFRNPGADGFRRLRELPAAAVLRELGIPWWKAPRVVRRVRAGMLGDPAPLPFFPGCAEILRSLDSKGVRWGIVTTNAHAFVRQSLDRAGLPEPGWLEADIALSGKARRLRHFLSTWGLDPSSTAYVSDEVRDLSAAREVGMPFLAAGWGYNSPQALSLAGARRVFTSLDELSSALFADGEAGG